MDETSVGLFVGKDIDDGRWRGQCKISAKCHPSFCFPLALFRKTFSLLLCMNESLYLSLSVSLSLRRPHWGGAGCVGATRWEEGGGAHALQETLAGGADLHGCIHASRWRHADWDTHLYLSSMYFPDSDVIKWDNIYLCDGGLKH